MANYKGITFPFNITGRGGVATSELTYNELSKIEESISQIIFTYPGERVMEPTFGCKLRDYLFENADVNTLGMIKYEIENAIIKWEPRVELKDIVISTFIDNDGSQKLFIDIYVLVVQYQVETSIQFTTNLT